MKFLEWPEELADDGGLVEIIEPLGNLYDEMSDCQAFLNTFDIYTNKSPEEEIFVNKSIENYTQKLLEDNDYDQYENLKVFTID